MMYMNLYFYMHVLEGASFVLKILYMHVSLYMYTCMHIHDTLTVLLVGRSWSGCP